MNVSSIPCPRIALVVLAAALAVAPLDAEANIWRYYSGHECQPANEDNDVVDVWSEGCANESETCSDNAVISLPISGRTSLGVNLDTAIAYYHDGTTLGAVECAIIAYNGVGTYYISSYLNSGTAYTGTGAIIWSGAWLPNSGNDMPNVYNVTMQCTLPAKKQAGGCTAQSASMIKAYQTDTVNP
jgi:hypothetical protein